MLNLRLARHCEQNALKPLAMLFRHLSSNLVNVRHLSFIRHCKRKKPINSNIYHCECGKIYNYMKRNFKKSLLF